MLKPQYIDFALQVINLLIILTHTSPIMETSRKSFKALSLAQPIKRQIDDTLNKLQVQKRKFLSMQRQQTSLKQQITTTRIQLNEVKLLQPKTRIKQNKNLQTHLSINNTDRLYLNTVNKISQLKVKIDVHRRQIQKYKKLIHNVETQITKVKNQNNEVENILINKQQHNQQVKDNLLQYRTMNMRNTDQFKNSFQALHRSSVKQENQRKKSQALRKSFNFEEMKSSNLVNLIEVEQQNNRLTQGESLTKFDLYMTNCIPLVKQRVRVLIHNNKQKIKISENYKKFGEQLENMFSIMKQYKGRDDVAFIADQFVMKEKQLKKIQQYIGKLQNRLMAYHTQLEKIKNSDIQLKSQLLNGQNQQNQLSDIHYIQLQKDVKHTITELHEKQQQNTQWFIQIGKLLSSVNGENEQINRGNIDKILGEIQQKYIKDDQNISAINQKSNQKTTSKNQSLPAIDQKQLKSNQAIELMSYQKLKQYAKQYITIKK